jgi:hypothetical protein
VWILWVSECFTIGAILTIVKTTHKKQDLWKSNSSCQIAPYIQAESRSEHESFQGYFTSFQSTLRNLGNNLSMIDALLGGDWNEIVHFAHSIFLMYVEVKNVSFWWSLCAKLDWWVMHSHTSQIFYPTNLFGGPFTIAIQFHSHTPFFIKEVKMEVCFMTTQMTQSELVRTMCI